MSLLPETSSAAQGNAVQRAAVVMLVSHFEGFLQGMAREFVDELNTGELQSRAIPARLRELHTIPKLESVVSSGDATQRRSLLKKIDRVVVLWKDDAKPARGTLEPERLSRVVTNASADVVNELFDLMGEKRPVCAGEVDVAEGEDLQAVHIEDFLKDIVSCRNDIAHGDVTRKPTRADVERYIRVLRALADRLNRKMKQRVAEIGEEHAVTIAQ